MHVRLFFCHLYWPVDSCFGDGRDIDCNHPYPGLFVGFVVIFMYSALSLLHITEEFSALEIPVLLLRDKASMCFLSTLYFWLLTVKSYRRRFPSLFLCPLSVWRQSNDITSLSWNRKHGFPTQQTVYRLVITQTNAQGFSTELAGKQSTVFPPNSVYSD